MGGVAIYLAFTVTTLAFGDFAPSLVAIWFGGTILAVLGVFDDIFNLNAWFKLGVQILAALVAVLQGVVIDFINIGGTLYPLGAWSVPITVLWIVGLTNAINFIDGLDGAACGISTICSTALTVVTLLMSGGQSALLTGDPGRSLPGFPALQFASGKDIYGRRGALFLGYTLSVLSVTGIFKTHTVLAFLIPHVDFWSAPLRYGLRRDSPSAAWDSRPSMPTVDISTTGLLTWALATGKVC